MGLRETLIIVGERPADAGDVLLLAGQQQRVVEGGSPLLALSTSVAFCASEPGITNLFSSVPLSGPNARKQITMNRNRPPNTVLFG
jgi:hypothetical protein